MIVVVGFPAATPTINDEAKPIKAKQVAITLDEMAEYSFTLNSCRYVLIRECYSNMFT